MKNWIARVFLMLCLSPQAWCHDEGHGPKLADSGNYGGLVSAVIFKKDAELGSKAPLIYKAELARASDGTARLYLYDSKMVPLDLKPFGSKIEASLASKVKGKWKSESFQLTEARGSFSGKMPKPTSKPYNIDVVLKDGQRELLTAFDNLD